MILTDQKLEPGIYETQSPGTDRQYLFNKGIFRPRDQMKLGLRSHDEIKLHHESIKTSLFISAVDLITICSTKIIKRFLNRKIYSHDLNVHLKEIHLNWSVRKFQNLWINVDMQQRKTGKFKARFHVNNPNYNKLASRMRNLLLFICL